MSVHRSRQLESFDPEQDQSMIDSSNNPSACSSDEDMSNDPSLRTSFKHLSPARKPPPRSYGDNFILDYTPACKWGNNELIKYRIHCQPVKGCDFFRRTAQEMCSPQWPHPEYMDILRYKTPRTYTAQSAGADKVHELLVLLRDIHVYNLTLPLGPRQVEYKPPESLTSAAVKHILQLIGLDTRGKTVVRGHLPIPFMSKGKFTHVTIDTGIYNQAQTLYLLLLTEEKRYEANCTPFGQLVAGAVAGFQYNNAIREKAGKAALDFMIIPGIIWIGSLPSFYHIKVTKELSMAVSSGTRPLNDTFVLELYPPIMPELRVFGLWRLRSRAVVMKILENLKDFVPKDHNDIPVGWGRFLTPEERQSLEQGVAQRTLVEIGNEDISDDVIMDTEGFTSEDERATSPE